jgi:hypothetical protein
MLGTAEGSMKPAQMKALLKLSKKAILLMNADTGAMPYGELALALKQHEANNNKEAWCNVARAHTEAWQRRCNNSYEPSDTDIAQGFRPLAVDGWPGPQTMLNLWITHRPDAQSIVANALRCTATPGAVYRLGSGGFDWFADDPLRVGDCAALIAHSWGCSRNGTGHAYGAVEWIETSQLVRDGQGKQTLVRAIDLDETKPGDLVAWPDEGGNQGHIGVVVGDNLETVDLSSSGYAAGTAIRRAFRMSSAGVSLWRAKNATGLRPVWFKAV